MTTTAEKTSKTHAAKLLIMNGATNYDIIQQTGIDKGQLSKLRQVVFARPDATTTSTTTVSKTEIVEQTPKVERLKRVVEKVEQAPKKVAQVDFSIVYIVLMMLIVPVLVGVAYSTIYYELIQFVAPYRFTAVVSTIALEVSPFIILGSNTACVYIFRQKGMDFSLTNIFRAILWVLCIVDIVGISYSLINGGNEYLISISYAFVLTVLHTGIISLANELTTSWMKTY